MSSYIVDHHVHFSATLTKPPADRPRNSCPYPRLAQMKGHPRKSDRVTSKDLYWGRRAVAAPELPHPAPSKPLAPISTLLSVADVPVPVQSCIAKTCSHPRSFGSLLKVFINVVVPAPSIDHHCSEKKSHRPVLSLVSFLPKSTPSIDSRASSRSTSSGTSSPTTPTSTTSSTASRGASLLFA
ncbi:hypothetical protein OF83DRAFT_1169910 [Amylostereum chailletii]|nr:hypothetical protein OF83DRAFT_1169910 [Amylostereum chailletii]